MIRVVAPSLELLIARAKYGTVRQLKSIAKNLYPMAGTDIEFSISDRVATVGPVMRLRASCGRPIRKFKCVSVLPSVN
jgi:hypothetical protein